MNTGFDNLVGKVLVAVSDMEADSEDAIFETLDGERYRMYHQQDCCQYVYINDVEGDVDDLLNSPVVLAEEVEGEGEGCGTWTFYRIATGKGFVVIRWYGESNGYYSESVSFAKIA